MIKIKIFAVIFLTLLLLQAGLTYGQDEAGGLFVSGRITTEQGNVGGAVIKLFRNGQPMVDYQVDNTGRFNLRFEFNNEYVLIFQRPDNFPQKYTVSTVVPANVLQRDRKFPPYPLDVNLFTEIKGVNKSFSENTVLRIYYSPAVDNFIHETYYNNAQIKKLIDQAILQSQSVNREAELLKRLSASELAALKRDYDAVLKKAGTEFDKGEYLLALDNYKIASRIFPAEQFPKDRIAEINDLIAVLGLEAELEKQQAEKYNQFIRQADQQFSAQQYEPSKKNYTQALYVRPGDSHATGRIAEIDRIVEDLKARQQYADIIAIADKAFKEKLWDESRRRYQEAMQSRPGESYPAAQIARIDEELQKLSQLAEKQSTFEAAVLNGDASYAKQFYPKALEFYRTALSIRPDDQAVLAKIAKVEKEQKDINDRLFYDETIANADRAFKRLEYTQARELYSSALTVRPDQTYPMRQIEAIDKIAERERDYENLIASGDAGMASGNYSAARDDFRKALEIKSGEKYPAQKIKEIDVVLAGQAKEDQQYRQLLATADKFFNANQFPQAKAEYQKASSQRPADNYPQEMLGKIAGLEQEAARLAEEQRLAEENRLSADQQQRDNRYQALVNEADRLVDGNELVAAVSRFRDALEVKPQESYPLQRIEEIRGIITRQTEAQKTYDTAIAAADRAFQQQRYPEARSSYQQAQQAKPSEGYPGEQLAKIDGIEAEQARQLAERQAADEAARLAAMEAKDREYAEVVGRADNLFKEQQYPQAIAEYRKAQQVKPEESYPAQQIAEADRLNSAMQAAQKAYDTAIAAADRAFQQQRYPEARSSYQQAQQAKPSEGYPGEQLSKIDGIEAEQARLIAERQAADEAARLAAMAAKDREYAEAVGRADNLFKEQQYPQAIAEYRKAQQVKPEESYPAQQIAEADRLNSAMQAAQKAYDTAIAAADRAFQQQRYPEARSSYQQAQQAKPSEGYPGEQLSKIDGIEAEQARQLAERQAADEAARLAAMAAKDREYAEAVGRADNLFKEQQYPQAIAEYRKAQQVKQEESYPAQQIAEADRLNSAMQAAQKAYDTAIAAADRAFQQQRYPEARSSYQQAQQAKPSEGYPGEQLSKIDGIEAEQARQLAERQAADEAARLAAMAAKDREYAEAVGRADNLFKEQQYPQAIAEYRKAQQVKPEESYPAQQIAEADRMNSAMQAAQKAYDTAIAAADRAFQQQRYPEARSSYQQAQQAKPSEGYPGEQLAKIDGIEAEQARQLAERQAADEAARLAAMAAKDREYAEAVGRADNLFKEQQYPQAIAEYRKAQQVKPEESYPAQQISEADRLNSAMQAAEARNREYVRFITLADRAFNNQEYNPAAANYRSALQAKPDETYPQERLEQIENIQKQRETDERYRQLLLAADGFFRASEWNQARGEYEKASDLKTSEEYPKEQIRRIDETLEKLAQRTAQAQPVAEVPASRQETASSESRVPAPSRQITDESDALYQSMLTVANESFDQQQYNVSRAWYYKALEVKPGEQFPNERISEINRLLGSMQLSQREREFQQFINQGDEAFRSDQLAVARGWYNRALTINPNDEYARAQIVEIQQEINSRLQGGADQVFAEYIKEGDKAFGLKNYSVARVWYQRARQLKPGDPQTMEKLDVVRKALAGEVE